MTEDDTFRRLKKSTFEELQFVFVEIARKFRAGGASSFDEWTNERNIAAEKHGWTVKEWQRENAKRGGQN